MEKFVVNMIVYISYFNMIPMISRIIMNEKWNKIK